MISCTLWGAMPASNMRSHAVWRRSWGVQFVPSLAITRAKTAR